MKNRREASLERRRKAMKRARRKSAAPRKARPTLRKPSDDAKPRRRAVRNTPSVTEPASKPDVAASKTPDRKARRDAQTVVRKAKRRAVRTGPKPAPTPARESASQPTQSADEAPTQKALQPEPKSARKAVRGGAKRVTPQPAKTDPQKTIYIDIERKTRLMIKWPMVLTNLTRMFTYDPDAPGSLSELCKVMGRIETSEKTKTTKKLAPLNYSTAVEAITVIKKFRKQVRALGLTYHLDLSDEFNRWFDEENAAKDVCREAYKHLDYDADTIQTEFPFLKAPLYPWQSAAMFFLNEVTRDGRGAILAEDTGLGKTWEAAAHLAWLKHTGAPGGGKAIIVCPAALRLPWQRKLRQATSLSTKVLDGKKYCLDAHKYDVLIIGYRALMKITGKASRQKRNGEMTRQMSPTLWYLKDLVEKQQRVLIMDEAHFAKEYSSQRAHMSLYLGEYAKHTLVLTATPIKNRVKELHPLLRVTRRLWTGASQKEFVKMYSAPEAQEEIAEHLVGEGGFMVRRLTPEVWVDAPKGEVVRAPCDLTNWDDYREVESNFINWLQKQNADEDKIMRAERGYVLTQLNMLRQLAANGKIRDTIQIINKVLNKGEQVVVFSDFKAPLKALEDRFKNKTGVNHLGQRWRGVGKIVGGQTDDKRMEMIEEFQAGKLGLMCVGIRAGGFGIDLPAARFAYFMDLPWSPADFEQCTGRILRLGQTRDCQFIKLLAPDTVDLRLESLIYDKAHTFRRTIGDEGIVDRVTGQGVDAMQDSIAKQIIRSYLNGNGLAA